MVKYQRTINYSTLSFYINIYVANYYATVKIMSINQ